MSGQAARSSGSFLRYQSGSPASLLERVWHSHSVGWILRYAPSGQWKRGECDHVDPFFSILPHEGSERSRSRAWISALAEDVQLSLGGLIVNVSRPRIRYVVLEHGLFRRNWSGPARNLREGLRKVADVVDIGIRAGSKQSVLLATQVDARCDAVLLIDYVAAVPEPFFIYFTECQESAVVADSTAYERATGLFAGSRRCAYNIARHSGISREKIHVVPPALSRHNNVLGVTRPRIRRAPRRKLLYVGDHCSKGRCLTTVQVILDALRILRAEHDPNVGLTVVGMEEWPFPGPPPDGVNFRGLLPADEISELFECHDLLAIPSSPPLSDRIFAEALSCGVPCLIPNNYQMPDAVLSGVPGIIFDESDAQQLAALIATTLNNDEIYRICYERAPAMAAYFSWDRVARQITQIISRELGLALH